MRLNPPRWRGFEQALEELGYSRREDRNIAAKGFNSFAEPEDDSQELIAAIKAASQLFQKA